MFHLIESKTIPLTPELAEEQLNLPASPTERPLNPRRVKFLAEKASADFLVPFQWSRAVLDGTTYRMNGQHSSKMLTELNGSFPKGAYVHLDIFAVDEKADQATLFRQFDSRQSARTPADVSGAYQGLHDDLREVPPPIGKLGVEGIAYYNRQVAGTQLTAGDDVYTLFDNQLYHPFLRWIGGVYSMKTPELKVVPVAAAMFSTFTVSSDKAKEFWTSVARGGIEFEDDAPATVLDAWLKEQKNPTTTRRMKVRPGMYYQGCIYAWNAFIEGRSIKDIKSRIDKGLLEPSF